MISSDRALSNGEATKLLHREMRVRWGAVPSELPRPVLEDDGFVLSEDSFLFTTDSGVGFHYARGHGVVASLPGPECEDEFRLYLWGTVFGVVAWLNGYIPLHASAVEVGGRAVAFTADSGGGKSTLAAALAGRGLPHVCDDTLAIKLIGSVPLAIPDRKPLKLWASAFELVPAKRLEPITSMPGKFYASAATRQADALPLSDLVVLQDGDAIGFDPVKGAEKLRLLAEALYREFVRGSLGRPVEYSNDMLTIANNIRIWRMVRPRSNDKASFESNVEQIAALIDSLGDVPLPIACSKAQ